MEVQGKHVLRITSRSTAFRWKSGWALSRGPLGMAKAVPLSGLLRPVPVVEKVIMEQGAPGSWRCQPEAHAPGHRR